MRREDSAGGGQVAEGGSMEDVERSVTTEMEFAAGETIERDESSKNDTNPSFSIKNSPVMPMSSIRFEPNIGMVSHEGGKHRGRRKVSSLSQGPNPSQSIILYVTENVAMWCRSKKQETSSRTVKCGVIKNKVGRAQYSVY
jgi:hypothetical protein